MMHLVKKSIFIYFSEILHKFTLYMSKKKSKLQAGNLQVRSRGASLLDGAAGRRGAGVCLFRASTLGEAPDDDDKRCLWNKAINI